MRRRCCRRQQPGPASRAEQLCVPGADFTNTFYLLSSCPVGPESPGLAEFLPLLLEQCASLEELRLAFRPQMDPRWVLGSCFLAVCSQGGRRLEQSVRGAAHGGADTVGWTPGAQAAAPSQDRVVVRRTVMPTLDGEAQDPGWGWWSLLLVASGTFSHWEEHTSLGAAHTQGKTWRCGCAFQ